MHSIEYFVVMRDFGRRGREAVVDPEITRREVISRIASGEYSDVLFVHHVEAYADGWGRTTDVTGELLDEARAVDLQAAE